jgi:hypothetical protein
MANNYYGLGERRVVVGVERRMDYYVPIEAENGAFNSMQLELESAASAHVLLPPGTGFTGGQ